MALNLAHGFGTGPVLSNHNWMIAQSWRVLVPGRIGFQGLHQIGNYCADFRHPDMNSL
ncbi:MAG: hypothetical protein AAFY39_19795 [Pseudomonadota bacterium]